ncbi:TlpA family protein disulfide reductase [Halobellus sp. Atlit-31R]|nr:TlpA family protein disulfide reductase [Halobellus sp. Atlit-31R]
MRQTRPSGTSESGGHGGASRTTRRGVVQAGVVGLGSLTGLAGCLGGSGGSGGGDLDVETLDVGGSPGGAVPVRPDGRVVFLDFFATWCPSCKTQMTNFRALAERFPAVHLLSITWEDDQSAVRAFWTRHGGTWPVATDPQMQTGQAFGVETVPTMLLFDSEGTRVWQDTGLASVEAMADAIEQARR